MKVLLFIFSIVINTVHLNVAIRKPKILSLLLFALQDKNDVKENSLSLENFIKFCQESSSIESLNLFRAFTACNYNWRSNFTSSPCTSFDGWTREKDLGLVKWVDNCHEVFGVSYKDIGPGEVYVSEDDLQTNSLACLSDIPSTVLQARFEEIRRINENFVRHLFPMALFSNKDPCSLASLVRRCKPYYFGETKKILVRRILKESCGGNKLTEMAIAPEVVLDPVVAIGNQVTATFFRFYTAVD